MTARTTQYFVLPNPAAPRWLPLWGRWVAANALGELMGLGFVAAIAGGLIWRFGEPHTTSNILLFTALMILLGAVEGWLLGWAQWIAVHPFFRTLPRRPWMKATTFGAVIAWGLGMIPSTLFALQETTSAAPPQQMQISDTTKYLRAALMGLGLGVVLGMPQWLVLRRYVNHAAWWVGANAVAWAMGMPIVLFGAGYVAAQTSGALLVLLIALTLLVAGAVVGALHGCVLVWLLQRSQSKSAMIQMNRR
jgi:hypothetical protein